MVARLRPLNASEEEDATLPAVSTAGKTVTVVRGTGSRQNKSIFKVDNVFGSSATQREIYEQTMPPIISDVMRGKHTRTAWAYTIINKSWKLRQQPLYTGAARLPVHRLRLRADGHGQDAHHGGRCVRRYTDGHHPARGASYPPSLPLSAVSRPVGLIGWEWQVSQIFESLQSEECSESSVSVSYLEIYNEELNDLLGPPASSLSSSLTSTASSVNSSVSDSSGKLVKHKTPSRKSARARGGDLRIVDGGGEAGVHCMGLSRRFVHSVSEVIEVIHAAQQRRKVGVTNTNKMSSRSHAVFTINVEHRKAVAQREQHGRAMVRKMVGKLHLVDLAGSENAKLAGMEGDPQPQQGE